MHRLFILSILTVITYGLTGEVELEPINRQRLSLNVEPSTQKVTIILSGGDQAWIAVGFNGTDMNNTYTILADYDNEDIYELKLGPGGCSPQCDLILKPIFTINSNIVKNNIRTINITRPINYNNPNYYSFPTTTNSTIQLIWSYGIPGQKWNTSLAMELCGNKKTITLS